MHDMNKTFERNAKFKSRIKERVRRLELCFTALMDVVMGQDAEVIKNKLKICQSISKQMERELSKFNEVRIKRKPEIAFLSGLPHESFDDDDEEDMMDEDCGNKY